MNRIHAALLFFFVFISISVFAQNIPLYNWRSHVPYLNGMQVVEAGSKIYCATQTGLFYYDKSDNTIHTLSKVDGYSDVFVKAMAYAPNHDILFIAYQNGNLDLVHAGKITNYPAVENELTINSIYIDPTESIAYFSLNSSNAEYGIYEWPLDEPEFHLNYNPNTSPNIYRVAVLGDSLYACSATGVKKVNLNEPIKTNPAQWETISTDSCGSIVSFGGRIIGAFQGGILEYYNGVTNTWNVIHQTQPHSRIQSIEAGNGQLVVLTNNWLYTYRTIPTSSDSFKFETGNDAIADVQGTIWMAQTIYVLLNYKPGVQGNGFFQPGGLPTTSIGNHAYGYHNQVWFSTGLITSSGAPSYDNHGFYMYDGETWHNYSQQTNYGKNNNKIGPLIEDFMGMGVDSITGHLWIAAMDSGIMEFDPPSNNIINIYNAGNTKGNASNSGLPPPASPQFKSQQYTTVSDVKFDHTDNIWVSVYNQFAQPPKNQLAEKKHNGGWVHYSAGPMTNVNSLVVDNYDNIWLIDSKDNLGVVIYSPSLNKTVTLSATAGQGGLPSAYVNCGVNDKNGEIWLGTTSGPCVYSDPSLLFGNTSYDVQRPYITAGSNAGYLLGSLSVTCIAVDGADRKWFGTSQGVWLTSPEGDKILNHFDITNSPLVSNQINAISINGVTGEVFFATDKGIVSYRDAATDGGDKNEGVYAFPNPVRPGYNGPITIRGLVTNANVKITDVTGALVYETTALGGEATWNGRNFSGREANSGVYLVFITNSDGSQTATTKILIVR